MSFDYNYWKDKSVIGLGYEDFDKMMEEKNNNIIQQIKETLNERIKSLGDELGVYDKEKLSKSYHRTLDILREFNILKEVLLERLEK